jgi:GTP pyrophosphokinase
MAQAIGFPDLDHLYASIGRGDTSPRQVLNRIKEMMPKAAPSPGKVLSLDRFMKIARGSVRGVRIQGVDNLMIRFAKCCQPVPGDRISGVITRGRGVTIHRIDCANAIGGHVEAERRVNVAWDVEPNQAFPVAIQLLGADRPGLLADVSNALAKLDTNIRNLEMSVEDGEVRGNFLLEVMNLNHLQRIIKAMERVKGVRLVGRKESASR